MLTERSFTRPDNRAGMVAQVEEGCEAKPLLAVKSIQEYPQAPSHTSWKALKALRKRNKRPLPLAANNQGEGSCPNKTYVYLPRGGVELREYGRPLMVI